VSNQASLDTVVTPDVDELVAEWLTVPDLADRIASDVVRTRQLLRDRQFVAVRRGDRNVVSIPAAFVVDGEALKGLAGLLTLLADAGYDENESIRWLFTPDESLPGTPVAALSTHSAREVRRRAQSLAF
jgi:hypothetical protein